MSLHSRSAVRTQHLILKLADRSYAIPTRCIEEIVPMAELVAVPGGPAFLRGFLNLGGRLVAVISLRRLLEMPDRERELDAPLVVLKPMPQQFALEVDQISRIVGINGDELIPVTEGCVLNNCATAVARLEDGAAVALSPERILLEQERRRVDELTELARRRLAELEEAPPC